MKVQLDGTRMTTSLEAHQYLQEALSLPAYYGKNLDALYDCLTEMGEMEISFVHTAKMRAALGRYAERMLQVFLDAENVRLEIEE